MIDRIEASVRSWVAGGPSWWVMIKTSLSHAMIWCGAVLVGALLGGVAMLVLGVHPFWAFSLPLLGYAGGARFYLDREFLGEHGDFWKASPGEGRTWKDRLKAAVDSLLDFWLPYAFATALLLFVIMVYPLGGL